MQWIISSRRAFFCAELTTLLPGIFSPLRSEVGRGLARRSSAERSDVTTSAEAKSLVRPERWCGGKQLRYPIGVHPLPRFCGHERSEEARVEHVLPSHDTVPLERIIG